MLNYFLFQHKLFTFFGQARSYQELSDKSWELHPAESEVVPAAIYIEKTLDRIKASVPFVSLDQQLDRAYGRHVMHESTRVYRLKDVKVVNSTLYKRALKEPLTMSPQSIWLSQAPEEKISSAALACTSLGNTFFGDFMLYDLPLSIISKAIAEPIRIRKKPYTQEMQYRQLLNLQARTVERAHFEELFIVDDRGQNSHKRERYCQLRSLIKQKFPPVMARGVMLKRGSTGTDRGLKNEAAVENFLKTCGFEIIEPEKYTVTELLKKISGVKVIVGVEGSQLTHGLYALADGGSVLTLQPPSMFNTVIKDFTDCLGMKFGLVVGQATEDGFEIPLNELEEVLNILETKMG